MRSVRRQFPGGSRERLRRLAAGSIVAIAALTVPLDPSDGGERTDTAESEIRSAIENWRSAFNAGDEEHVCDLFAPDLVANYKVNPSAIILHYAKCCARQYEILLRNTATRYE